MYKFKVLFFLTILVISTIQPVTADESSKYLFNSASKVDVDDSIAPKNWEEWNKMENSSPSSSPSYKPPSRDVASEKFLGILTISILAAFFTILVLFGVLRKSEINQSSNKTIHSPNPSPKEKKELISENRLNQQHNLLNSEEKNNIANLQEGAHGKASQSSIKNNSISRTNSPLYVNEDVPNSSTFQTYGQEDFPETLPAKDNNKNVAGADNTPNNPSQKQSTELEKAQGQLRQEFFPLFPYSQKPQKTEAKVEVNQQQGNAINSDIELIKQQIKEIQTQLKKPATFPADAYPHLITEPDLPLLDLPMGKVIDLYHEMPQVLELYCHRVSLSTETDNILERNDVGNFWALQLQDQGFCLFPRPTSFGRYKSLKSFRKLFVPTNQIETDNNQFTLVSPAKLQMLKHGEKWLLLKSGKILFGEAPLEFQWQQEITNIRNQYEQFNQLFNERGYAGLDFTIASQQLEQSLLKQYGSIIGIFINTCMPIAYAIYEGDFLVPCQILMGNNPIVVPTWDRGVPLKSSIYSSLQNHYDANQQRFLTPNNHPVLPNQVYVKEVNGNANHTWAIAKSYTEASDIVRKINGRWISLLWSNSN